MMELLNSYKTDVDIVEVQDDKDRIKQFERINGKWELVFIADDLGVHELTSIPNFSNYRCDIERGKIFSLKSDRWLSKGKPNYYGYCFTTMINDDGESVPMSLHSIVMSSMTGMTQQEWREEGLEIDHVNELKHDNRGSNLRLVTRKEQYTDSVRERMSGKNAGTPLTEDEVRYIRYLCEMIEAKGERVDSVIIHMIAKKYGRKYETIRKVINGVTHKDVELTDEMKAQVTQARLEHDLEQIQELIV